VAFLAVAHQAAGDEVRAHGEAAVDLGHNVIERWTAAERFIAIGAPVPPSEVDLVTRRSPGDEARFINVVLIH
jgi:hypothetical protein